MKKVGNIFLDSLPQIDLHGYTGDMARVAVDDFILENTMMGNSKCVIIHGIGDGIVRKSVHETLRKNKLVQTFYLDNMNIGCTIVSLGIDKQM